MDTLITALPRLLTRWPEVQLAFVGTGDDRAWLEDLAEQNGVNRHVHFLSGLSSAELRGATARARYSLYRAGVKFRARLFGSDGARQTGHRGNHGGAPEIIQDGISGYLVPHGDAIQLATSIEALLADRRMRKRWVRADAACGSRIPVCCFRESLQENPPRTMRI